MNDIKELSSNFPTNNNNNSFDDFIVESKKIDNSDPSVITFVFTSTSLSLSTFDFVHHDPNDVDCAFSNSNLVLITRSNNRDYIPNSAWHETLHTFNTKDHYCSNKVKSDDSISQPIETICENQYCYYYVLSNNTSAGNNSENDTECLPYSVYRLQYSQLFDKCVMYSPINYGAKDSVCGICLIRVFYDLIS